MQTNGTLITDSVAATLGAMGCSVGVSLDGPKNANDRHRVNHAARSSFDATIRGIESLKRFGSPNTFAGILSVIDLETNPLEVFDFLASFDPAEIDFLLPHGNWLRPPPGKERFDAVSPYADWLIPIFDVWLAGRRAEIAIRTFEEMILHISGGRGSLETLVLEPVTILAVGTDGSIEAVDTMKSAFVGVAEFKA